MSVGHISIFLPRPTQFYSDLFGQMKRGFEAHGVHISGALRHLNAEAMRQWCAEKRPQVVFEMNRARCEVPSLPRSIRHIVWVVDLGGRPVPSFAGSEIAYFFSPGWQVLYGQSGFNRWMGPGADEQCYPAAPHIPATHASFVGHMPLPWTEAQLRRNVTGGHANLTFADLLPDLERWLRSTPETRTPVANDSATVADILCRRYCGHPLIADDALRYDICGRLVRHIGRGDVADALVRHAPTLAFYGSPNWSHWPTYAPHYRGLLDRPSALHAAYVGSAINVHEGNGVHFRSMDVMSSRGLLFYREHWNDAKPGGMHEHFEPEVHYVPFTLDTLGEQMQRYLREPKRADRVRENAAEAIAARHTWKHRAAGVLRDIQQVR
ncbi:MAG: glycosyltransferase [Nannocystaceae bacterium]